jgi:hypothetical protein
MTQPGQSDSPGEVAVTLHYAEWARLLRLLDQPLTGGEGDALAHAIRKQALDQLARQS